MKIASDWLDYEVIATGDGEKLERWGNIKLLRPDPQVIWPADKPLKEEKGLNAHYIRESSGGGYWKFLQKTPDDWKIRWKNLSFKIKLMGFKHTGIFPEQSINWQIMIDLINKQTRKIKVLNLFAYTGGATVACASVGASVVHVDASRGMVDRARENLLLSGLGDVDVRFIVDDCIKFVEREIRRGNFYDAIIMDPPSYGRGPGKEVWKIETEIFNLVALCKKILSKEAIFVLINSYTTGLQPIVLSNILNKVFFDIIKETQSYELGLKTDEKDIILPCGCSGICKF